MGRNLPLPKARGWEPEGDLYVLRDWQVRADGTLRGHVFGHPKAVRGSVWDTTPIVGVRHRLAVTASGTHYVLAAARSPGEARRLAAIVRRRGGSVVAKVQIERAP